MSRRSSDPDRELRAMIAEGVDTVLTPRLASLTTPVFWPDDRGLPELVGTCLTVRFGEACVLFTAGHVLDMAAARPLAIVVDNTLREIHGEMTRFHPIAHKKGEEDHIDVGAVVLSPECIPGEILTLADLQLSVPRCGEADMYLVMGYPCSKNRKSLRGDQFEARLYHFLAAEASTSEYVALDRNAREQLVLRFNRKDVWRPAGRATAPDLYGVSGGGVWHLAPEGDVPISNAQLAAIAVEWHDKAHVKHVLATRLQPLVALLAGEHPVVKDAVLAFLRDAA